MEWGDTTVVDAPSYAALERAIASVPGVVDVSIGASPDTGRGRLRLRLVPGADPQAVSWAVAATLRERFDITLDPTAIRPRTEPEPRLGPEHDPVRVIHTPRPSADQPLAEARTRLDAAARVALDDLGSDVVADGGVLLAGDPRADVAGVGTAPRPAGSRVRNRMVFRDLVTERGPGRVEVTACLGLHDERARGRASGVPTARGLSKAVAEATMAAARALSGDLLVAGVDQVARTADVDPPIVRVLVTLRSDDGDETLVGAAVVRDDPEHAVVRATLDALNRRLELLLDPDGVG